jgi:signal transduction histidine kinase
VILGNLEKASHLLNPDQDRVRRCVDQALQASERAATLTQQLLAFARRQPLRPKPTDINQLVRQWVDLIRRTLPESVTTRAVLDEVVGIANVDANQLESSLLNLAINARDAMPNGGTLTLETSAAWQGFGAMRTVSVVTTCRPPDPSSIPYRHVRSNFGRDSKT